jgi:hypothetical protein
VDKVGSRGRNRDRPSSNPEIAPLSLLPEKVPACPWCTGESRWIHGLVCYYCMRSGKLYAECLRCKGIFVFDPGTGLIKRVGASKGGRREPRSS